MTDKRYQVVYTMKEGMVLIDFVLSEHSTRPAAFRALHKLQKDNPTANFLYVQDKETGQIQIEVKSKESNGRWRTI